MTTKPISELTWEELLARREVLLSAIEELEAEKSVLSDEFMIRLQKENLSGKVVGNWSITKSVRYSFSTTVEQATELGAVQQKIVVDNTMLKELTQKGVQVPGAKKLEYIMVREVVKNKEIENA